MIVQLGHEIEYMDQKREVLRRNYRNIMNKKDITSAFLVANKFEQHKVATIEKEDDKICSLAPFSAPTRLLAVVNPRSFWGVSKQNLSAFMIVNGTRLNFHPRPKVKSNNHLHGDSKTKGRLSGKIKTWQEQGMARARHSTIKCIAEVFYLQKHLIKTEFSYIKFLLTSPNHQPKLL
jgi:hypothetical protein